MTSKQRELLNFIIAYQRDHDGVSPSFDDMTHALGLASKSGVHRLLTALQDAGYITRPTNRARRIYVTCPPDQVPPQPERRPVLGVGVDRLARELSERLDLDVTRVRRALLEIAG
jgi:SOS-response transcriptional repressor LexA